ncbi:hypothetical protein RIF29_27756 [Crotalaria pallida]|uniref:DDE Tnp4 domain-containing protein n=1 Tax=Crotalaria pallida TaxID=3830 RepID=A0AAN9I1B5_CROPI
MDRVRGQKRRRRNVQNVYAASASGSKVKEEPKDESPSIKNDIHLYTKCSGNFGSGFTISAKTFEYICSLVKDDMMGRPTCFNKRGEPMSLYDQVAVALRRLASGEPAAHPVEESSDVTWRFVEAMEKSGLKHIKWPSTETDMKAIKSRFEKLNGLPNCCGVIHATHFNLCTASSSTEPSLDQSMVMQAIVDPAMKFMDVCAGWPGSMHESLIFEHSKFKELCDMGDRLRGKKLRLSKGVEIREYILGSSGYPMLPYLIVPYEGNDELLTDAEAKFNKVHFATRAVAMRALWKLKETWKIINGIVQEPDRHRLPSIILVCCILHNIVIDMEDKEDKLHRLPSITYAHHDEGSNQLICGAVDEKGIALRENLSRYLAETRRLT